MAGIAVHVILRDFFRGAGWHAFIGTVVLSPLSKSLLFHMPASVRLLFFGIIPVLHLKCCVGNVLSITFADYEPGLQADSGPNTERCTAWADSFTFDSLQQNPHCMQQTSHGPVYIRGGILAFLNPNFFTEAAAEVSSPYVAGCSWYRAAEQAVEFLEHHNEECFQN